MYDMKNKIPEYIHGELPEDQCMEFEKLMQEDSNFAQEVKMALNIKTGLDTIRIRGKVLQVGLKEKKKRKIRNLNFITGVAATIAVILGTEFIYRKFYSENEKLVKTDTVSKTEDSKDSIGFKPSEENYVIDSNRNNEVIAQNQSNQLTTNQMNWLQSNLILIEFNVLREEGRGESFHEQKLESAKRLIDKAEFRQALKILNEIIIQNDSEIVRFLKAYCHFQLREYKSAQTLFFNTQQGFQYPYESEWNYLLCCYLLKDSKTADTLLNKLLADLEHPYHHLAQQLVKNLK